MPDEEPKIFIDEDWKSQVAREREEARKRAEAAQQQQASAAPPQPAAAPGGDNTAEAAPEPEEANFMSLVASLATQAMFALGAIAQPGETQVMVDLDQARYLLDTLGMLSDKTKGNLSPEEDTQLREARAELQHIFIARIQQLQEQTMREAGIDLTNLRGPAE